MITSMGTEGREDGGLESKRELEEREGERGRVIAHRSYTEQ